ncbi:MAG TPA: NapC/NirT family cytochrome c, partial [Vicinamibacterales bacterium]|nr:NapC/NirT family cytochrome c [Vicinamibacterales bacterium]
MARDVRLIRSPLSVTGMVLTTISAVLFLVVFLADLFGLHSNPYIGLVFFVILPGAFVLGLLLIPLGAWLERRRRRAGKAPSEVSWPQIDLNKPDHRRTAVAIFALTLANVVIVSLGAYRGVEYMDSVQFCSLACHGVMKPEGTAHQNGPHARVACVACHVGSGATSFARAKLSGTRQLIALALGTYPRPISTPVRNMVPARDTC